MEMIKEEDYLKFKKNHILYLIIVAGLILRVLVLINYGVELTLDSDDVGYLNTAITLSKQGILTYNSNQPSVIVPPGVPLLLVTVFKLFGYGIKGIYLAKIVYIIIGGLSILGVYMLGKELFNYKVGMLAALILAFSPTQAVTDNLFLTETPFMTSFIFLLYFTIKLFKTKNNNDFYLLLIFYLICLVIKPVIALYPIFLIIFFIASKYPRKLLFKQLIYSILLLLIFLSPWWIRNYKITGQFVPLTGASGAPLLEGSFQGKGYPNDESYSEIIEKLNKKSYSNIYFNIKDKKDIAISRIEEWWNNDKKSFIYSYGYYKPKILWKSPFYWIKVFDLSNLIIYKFHNIFVNLAIIGIFLSTIFDKKKRKETLFIIFLLGYFTCVYSINYVMGRYVQSLLPILYIYASVLIIFVVNKLETFSFKNKIDTMNKTAIIDKLGILNKIGIKNKK